MMGGKRSISTKKEIFCIRVLSFVRLVRTAAQRIRTALNRCQARRVPEGHSQFQVPGRSGEIEVPKRMPTLSEEPLIMQNCSQCQSDHAALYCSDDPDFQGPPSSRPRYCATCMIGKKVRVFWPVDESWYTGTVQEFDPTSGEHLLRYPDGDSEWVRIGESSSRDAPPSPGGGDFKDVMGMSQAGRGPFGPYVPPPYMLPPGSMHFPTPAYGYPPPPPMPAHLPIHDSPRFMERKQSLEYIDRSKCKAGPKAWTKEEDSMLLSIVQSMQMPMKWSVVAQSLTGRTGKQCRERYVNHLNPRLKVTDWTILEDATIFHLYNSIGSHWAKMSKVIPGRTDNGIKNRFHNLRRQYEKEDENRLRLTSADDYPHEIRTDRLRKIPELLKARICELWDVEKGIGVLAAHSVSGSTSNRDKNSFGPMREPHPGEQCARCGFFIPCTHCGNEVCSKTGWCFSCTRVPPHLTSNHLRECLNLRREQDLSRRAIIESWPELLFEKTKTRGRGKGK